MTCSETSPPAPPAPASPTKTPMFKPQPLLSVRSASPFLHLPSHSLTEHVTSSRLYIVYNSSFSCGSGSGKRGVCACSEDAVMNETLVNETIIVFPLFNVQICDILYLKYCIYYECFSVVSPFPFTVCGMQEAGSSVRMIVTSASFLVTAAQPSKQSIVCLQNQ